MTTLGVIQGAYMVTSDNPRVGVCLHLRAALTTQTIVVMTTRPNFS